MSPQVEPRGLAGRRRLQAVGGARHRARELLDRPERVGCIAHRVEVRQRLAAELGNLLLHARARDHAATAQTPFEEIDVVASEPRVRGAQEGEQVSPVALQPGVAQQRQQRLPERRLAEAQAALERVRDAECCEGRVERRAPAFERRADDRDLVGLGAGAQQREQLLGDELQGPAQARALEEADRPVELRPRASRSGVTKERALQMREWSRARTGVRRQLFAALGERVQVVGGPRERGEGVAPGLVGQRHGHLGTRGQRLQQRPLSAGEVLEAVREDGLGAPGVEVAA